MASEFHKYTPCFLVGVMRSGTTWLRNILASNRQILAIPAEMSEFWTDCASAPSGTVPENPRRVANHVTPQIQDVVHTHFDQLYETRNSALQIAYRIYRRVRYHNESLLKTGSPFYILNKSTHFTNKLPFLTTLFPACRIIFLIRDIYSQVHSLDQHVSRLQSQSQLAMSLPDDGMSGWSFCHNSAVIRPPLSELARYWIQHNSLVLSDIATFPASQSIVVPYSKLVADPARQIRHLSEFLGTPLSTNVSQAKVNSYTSSPLTTWKAALSERDKQQIKATIREFECEFNLVSSVLDETVIHKT